MKIFETKRLIVKSLDKTHKSDFIELLSDPKVINPIPQPQFSEAAILERFNKNLNITESVFARERTVCGVFLKDNPEMIGLCLFLTNEELDKEIGYRFKYKNWGNGYTTELAEALISFYFSKSEITKITADVTIANKGSLKILNKFFKPVRDFYNDRDQTMDRRFAIHKKEWIKR